MKTKFTLLSVLLVLLTFSVKGQQDAQYSQYMLNPLMYNSAYAGSREVISVAALHRSQWLGVDGAPSTQNISVHAPVWRRVGLGLLIVNDVIGNGTVQQTEFRGMFSYTIPFDNDGKLAFGLNVGGTLNDVNLANLVISNNTGVAATQESRFLPNFGAGIFYRHPQYYFGVSNPNLLQNVLYTTPQDIEVREVNSWYGVAGLIIDYSSNIKLKPATLLKVNEGAPLQVDTSLTMLFNEKFMAGASYRWGAALSGLVGYQFSDKLFGGIAYDQEFTDLGGQAFRGNSFEFLIRYEFEDRKCKCSPKPRFY